MSLILNTPPDYPILARKPQADAVWSVVPQLEERFGRVAFRAQAAYSGDPSKPKAYDSDRAKRYATRLDGRRVLFDVRSAPQNDAAAWMGLDPIDWRRGCYDGDPGHAAVQRCSPLVSAGHVDTQASWIGVAVDCGADAEAIPDNEPQRCFIDPVTGKMTKVDRSRYGDGAFDYDPEWWLNHVQMVAMLRERLPSVSLGTPTFPGTPQEIVTRAKIYLARMAKEGFRGAISRINVNLYVNAHRAANGWGLVDYATEADYLAAVDAEYRAMVAGIREFSRLPIQVVETCASPLKDAQNTPVSLRASMTMGLIRTTLATGIQSVGIWGFAERVAGAKDVNDFGFVGLGGTVERTFASATVSAA